MNTDTLPGPPQPACASPSGAEAPGHGWHLVFQPQVHLSSGNVIGFEVLLHREPPHDADAPGKGPGLADSGCLAGDLVRRVLARGVEQLRTWEDAGHHGLQMAFKLPPGVFERPGIDEHLCDLLARHEIVGNQIELEIDERSLAAADAAVVERLRALRERGVAVVIAEFGSGHSSLSRLTRLPLDGLKIAPRLLQRSLVDPADALVARMSGDIARALKLRLVAEGIATDGQLELASRLGCELGQGGLFAPALAAAEATALLQSGRCLLRSREPRPQRHLLLLDDEPNILRSLRRVFRAQNWTVHTAGTPDEAFELLARHPVGVVVSDQRMPLMRGTEFLARVKQLHPDTVRMVLSGYTELQSVTDAINEGAIYKFLTKPWNDRQLNEDIEQAFRQYEMVAERGRLQQRLRESNRQLESRLRRNAERLQHEQVALDVTHEALEAVPVPILGIDASGMIAISNVAADALLGGGASVVGEHVSDVLPAEAAPWADSATCPGSRVVRIGEALYEVHCNELAASSRGTGTVITLLRGAAP